MAALMTSVLVTAVAPLLVYLWPHPPKGQKKGILTVALDKPIDQLNDGEALRFNAPASTN
jgi:hypothetical protein